jgi:hypothetical protein
MKWMIVPISALVLWPASAEAETPYIDNRSSAELLVRSLYNAIDRKEYARAWSYFANPPSSSFAAYADGYATTESIELEVGKVAEEGAAGSTFYSVPIAIRSRDTANEERSFAGCYTVRQVNGAIQEPPFRPLLIDKGKLKVSSSANLFDALPDCGAGTTSADDFTPSAVIDLYKASFAGECDAIAPDRQAPIDPDVHVIKYRYAYQAADEPAQVSNLYVFPCSTYAYNWSNVYLIQNGAQRPEVLSFAEPSTDTKFVDDAYEKLTSIAIDGYTALNLLINSEFDAASNTISFFAKGRGVGDISSSGTYTFREGIFVLTDYASDPTGNGEMDPIDLIKNGKTVEPVLPPEPAAQ